MSGSMSKVGLKQLCVIALCASAALASSVSSADDDRNWRERIEDRLEDRRHDGDRRHDRRHDDGRHDRRHDDRRHDRRHDDRRHWRDDDDRRRWDRRSHWRDDHRRHRDHGYRGRDWHYYNGRYWAPPQYRGRHCNDRRHHHGAHYHVAASDYYDYYYPRYRYYGPRPYGANASVIISIPLF